MRRLWLWIGARLGWLSEPPPRRVTARMVIDPELTAAIVRSQEIARALRALEAQRDVAQAEAEAEAAREAG